MVVLRRAVVYGRAVLDAVAVLGLFSVALPLSSVVGVGVAAGVCAVVLLL